MYAVFFSIANVTFVPRTTEGSSEPPLPIGAISCNSIRSSSVSMTYVPTSGITVLTDGAPSGP
jgi:hypothetical protein